MSTQRARRLLAVVPVCFCVAPAFAQSTIVCNTYPGMGDNGSDVTVCRAISPLESIIQMYAGMIYQHRVTKASEEALSTFKLAMKYDVLLANLSALFHAVTPSDPVTAKWDEVVEMQKKADDDMLAAYLKGIKENGRLILASRKNLKEYRDGLLRGACPTAALWSTKLASPWKKFPIPALQQLTAAIDSSVASLQPDCASKHAVKLLKKEAEKARRAKPPDN